MGAVVFDSKELTGAHRLRPICGWLVLGHAHGVAAPLADVGVAVGPRARPEAPPPVPVPSPRIHAPVRRLEAAHACRRQ